MGNRVDLHPLALAARAADAQFTALQVPPATPCAQTSSSCVHPVEVSFAQSASAVSHAAWNAASNAARTHSCSV